MEMFNPRASAAFISSFDDFPTTADEIDLDRVVWDPAYRCAVKGLLLPGAGTAMNRSGND